jgi:hypothetical protein
VEAKDAGQNTCLWKIAMRVDTSCTSEFGGRRKIRLLIVLVSAVAYPLSDSQI